MPAAAPVSPDVDGFRPPSPVGAGAAAAPAPVAALDDTRVDNRTSVANSGVVLRNNRQAMVELDPNHPGFRDAAYRKRRDIIAQIAVDHRSGTPVPDAPYTEEEHEVWRTIWRGLDPVHARRACRAFLEASAELALPKDRIPQLREVSTNIERLTGFRLEPVAGLVHPRVFLSTLGQGIFLSTQYIRHHSTPEYTPEPDVVHELVGHAGTLANGPMAELNRLTGLAAAATRDDADLDKLGRVYWRTIEFGALMEDGEVKAYGAGLLSSFGEMTEGIDRAEKLPYDFDMMAAMDYDVTQYQPVLFVAPSFSAMHAGLKSYLQAWIERGGAPA